jgi:hypothetical protein
MCKSYCNPAAKITEGYKGLHSKRTTIAHSLLEILNISILTTQLVLTFMTGYRLFWFSHVDILICHSKYSSREVT